MNIRINIIMKPCLPRWTPAAIVLIAGSTNSFAAGLFGASFELSSLNGTNGFVCNGIDAGDRSGNFISSAGDINGDGIDDLIIGASRADKYEQDAAGETYVIFGGVGVGAGGTLELSSLNGSNGFVYNGVDSNDRSGSSVSSAGDINGDGIGDLIIGASLANPNGQYSAGESYVVYGAVGIGSGGTLELSSLNGTNGFVCNGIDVNDRSGISVSGAGDVNGDGIGDLIIGAFGADPNGRTSSGESYVVFGAAGIGAGGTLELSSLNGTNGFVCNGIDAWDYSGASVSSAGDVNGDGFDDLIIGAKFSDPNEQNNAGESYVVFGGVGVGAGGSLELSSLNGMNGFVCNGIDRNDFSSEPVSSAGDVNSDGFDDIIIGAHNASPNGASQGGESYVVFGAMDVGSGGTLNLSTLNGINGFACNGIDMRDFSGNSVSSAGDVNGDGFGDLIIGAPFADPNEHIDVGEAYVVFGAAGVGSGGTLDLMSLNGQNGFVLNGIDTGDVCGFVSSAGDVNGDGISDFIIGAPDADPNGQDGAGESYVVFGRKPCPADLNADGVVDTADLGIVIGQFGTPGPGADINGDGTVDTADLGVLIGAFGTTSCD